MLSVRHPSHGCAPLPAPAASPFPIRHRRDTRPRFRGRTSLPRRTIAAPDLTTRNGPSRPFGATREDCAPRQADELCEPGSTEGDLPNLTHSPVCGAEAVGMSNRSRLVLLAASAPWAAQETGDRVTSAAPTPHGRTAETVGEMFWREELAQYLTTGVFPADQDELQAALSRHRAPSRLHWHLAPLSPGGSTPPSPRFSTTLTPRRGPARPVNGSDQSADAPRPKEERCRPPKTPSRSRAT
jgi:hypothetical protein